MPPSPSDLRICYMLPERNWVFLSVILVIYHIVYCRNKFHLEKMYELNTVLMYSCFYFAQAEWVTIFRSGEGLEN